MTDLSTLRALQATVRATDGPDRMLDRKLCVTLGVEPWINTNPDHIEFCMTGSKMDKATPALTASIDAAVALIEKLLPRNDWYVNRDGAHVGDVVYFADVWDGFKRERHAEVIGKTPPLALVDALLSSLIAKAEAELSTS